MGHRSFVVELKKEADIATINEWLKGDSWEDTDYGPYDSGMVVMGARQFALLNCDCSTPIGILMGMIGIRNGSSRVFIVGDPDGEDLYNMMQEKGKHYRVIKWRKK